MPFIGNYEKNGNGHFLGLDLNICLHDLRKPEKIQIGMPERDSITIVQKALLTTQTARWVCKKKKKNLTTIPHEL